MQFTKEYPNKEGWYWVKTAGSNADAEVMFAEFHEDGFGANPPGFYFLVDDFPIKLKSTFDWRFAGPLEIPSD